MNKTIIIGICGEINHGKSELARRIECFLNSEFYGSKSPDAAVIRKIAAPLYNAAADLTGGRIVKGDTYQIGDRMMTGRQLLQEMADHFRAIDKRSLVQSVVNFARETSSYVVLCDDIRTPECVSICDHLIGVVCRNRSSSGENHETEAYVSENLSKAEEILYWTDDGSGKTGYETELEDTLIYAKLREHVWARIMDRRTATMP